MFFAYPRPRMWLPWEYAAVLAAACFAVARWSARSPTARPGLTALANEGVVLSVLYALWQLAGRLSILKIDDAVERGLRIVDFQNAIWLPSEQAWQAAILDMPWLVQASNIYYGGAHAPGMGVFLIWLFFRHRSAYPPWRTTLAITTGLCLLIQLLPVAPPRLIPELGMVDTGREYGQSVYAAFGSRIAGQLQAMPSIHVAWAALITGACWGLGGWKTRAVGVFHGVATMLVVVVTANHYWLDGIVAVAILVVVYPGVRALTAVLYRWRRASGPGDGNSYEAR